MSKTVSNKIKIPAKILEQLAKSEKLKLSGKNQKALEIAENILSTDPECAEAAEEIADNFLVLGDFKKARSAAEYALFLDSESSIANFVLGFVESHHENFNESIKFLRKANSNQSNNPEILRCLGWSLFHAKKEEEGISTLLRAGELDLKNSEIFCDLGVCFLQKSNFKKAAEFFSRAAKIDPEDSRAQEFLKIAENLQSKVSKKIV